MKRVSVACFLLVLVPSSLAALVTACGDDPTAGVDDAEAGLDGANQKETGRADTGSSSTDANDKKDATGGDAHVEAGPSTVYCNTTATYDAGADAAAAPVPAAQIFSATMAGCPGTVYWRDRGSLCGASCKPCTATQWVQEHGVAAPEYHYWTDDDLGWSGQFASGKACFASPRDAGPDAAPANNACKQTGTTAGVDAGPLPMRVCRPNPSVPPYTYTQFDPLANACNWVRCAYGTDASVPDAGPDANPDAAGPVFDYMGGCEDNLTAGTLCCCQ